MLLSFRTPKSYFDILTCYSAIMKDIEMQASTSILVKQNLRSAFQLLVTQSILLTYLVFDV